MGHILAANSEEEQGQNPNAQMKQNTCLRNGANGAGEMAPWIRMLTPQNTHQAAHTSVTAAPRDTTSSSRLLSDCLSQTHIYTHKQNFFQKGESRHLYSQPRVEAIQWKIQASVLNTRICFSIPTNNTALTRVQHYTALDRYGQKYVRAYTCFTVLCKRLEHLGILVFQGGSQSQLTIGNDRWLELPKPCNPKEEDKTNTMLSKEDLLVHQEVLKELSH